MGVNAVCSYFVSLLSHPVYLHPSRPLVLSLFWGNVCDLVCIEPVSFDFDKKKNHFWNSTYFHVCIWAQTLFLDFLAQTVTKTKQFVKTLWLAACAVVSSLIIICIWKTQYYIFPVILHLVCTSFKNTGMNTFCLELSFSVHNDSHAFALYTLTFYLLH